LLYASNIHLSSGHFNSGKHKNRKNFDNPEKRLRATQPRRIRKSRNAPHNLEKGG